jgi:hypothetical protein
MRRGGLLIVVVAVLAVLAWFAWDATREGPAPVAPQTPATDGAPAPAREPTARARAKASPTETLREESPPDAAPPPVVAPDPHALAQIRVVVRHADGTPAVGAVVELRLSEDDDPPPGAPPRRPATTDAEGRAVVVAGPVNDQRFGDVVHAVWEDREAAIEQVPPVVPEEMTLTLGAGVRVEGRTEDAEGAPIAGAKVSLRWPATARRFAGDAVWSAVSDGAGAFRFPPLPPLLDGQWGALRADAAGFAHANEYLGPDEADAAPVVLELARAVGFAGRVLGPDRKPVPGATIRCEGADDAETAADGRFALDGVPAGAELLTVDSKSHAPLVVRDLPGGGGDLGDLVLVAGGTLRGVFVDAGGKPVAAGQLWVRSDDDGDWSRQASTGDDGRFEIPGLPDADLEIEATAHGRKFGEGRSVTVKGLRTGQGDVRIALPAGLRAAFRLRLASDRSVVRVPRVSVDVEKGPPGHTISSRSWESSTADIDSVVYEFEAAGTYVMKVSVPGHAPVTIEDLEVREDRPAEVDVLLVPETPR